MSSSTSPLSSSPPSPPSSASSSSSSHGCRRAIPVSWPLLVQRWWPSARAGETEVTHLISSIPLTSLRCSNQYHWHHYFVQIDTIDITLSLKSIHSLGQLRSIKCLSQRIIILTIVLITRSGNAVFTISGGSAVYSSRSNFTEFDTNNLEHKSAFKIDHNSKSILIQHWYFSAMFLSSPSLLM